MKTVSLSIQYHLKWRFRNYPEICISNDKNRTILNLKTNRIIKQTVCSYSIGYWINKKFIPVSKINDMVELIPTKIYCPF